MKKAGTCWKGYEKGWKGYEGVGKLEKVRKCRKGYEGVGNGLKKKCMKKMLEKV